MSSTPRDTRARSCALLAALLLAGVVQAEPLTARVHWVERVSLGVPVSGVVEHIAVTPGQIVKRGEVLLHLDPRPFAARVEEAKAGIAAIEPELAEARREHERARDLYDRTVLSGHELQVARSAELTLAARQRHASAVLARARIELERSTLRAPFDGIVLDVPAGTGQAVAAGLRVEPLLVLAATGTLRARALVSSEQLARLVPGLEVDVVSSRWRRKGIVRFVSPEPALGETDPPRYAVDVHFAPEAGLPVRVGESVEVVLP